MLNLAVDICTQLIGTEGVRLLRDAAGEVRPLNSFAVKMAHPRPAESERLQWKSTARLTKIKKKMPTKLTFSFLC
ncbi:hypothetical protein E2R51_14540 [Jeotgalibacillus sp. S-D1]|nr:hypothetical protein E2R51_14540 [Jeotgalibacillus sp. S-D1]